MVFIACFNKLHVRRTISVASCVLEHISKGNFQKGFIAKADALLLSLNVKSIFMLTRDLLPLLEAAGSAEDPARVINIGSIDGFKVPFVNNFSYSASTLSKASGGSRGESLHLLAQKGGVR